MTEVPSTWLVTKTIINDGGLGLNGLNKGLTATIARNGIFNMVYFGFYHSVKNILPEYEVSVSNVMKFKQNNLKNIQIRILSTNSSGKFALDSYLEL